jgi:hypothetical protein
MLLELTLYITDNMVRNGFGAGEMRIGMGNRTNQRKHALVPHCQSQTSTSSDLGMNMHHHGAVAISHMNYGRASTWILFKVSCKSAFRNTNL